MNDYRKMKGDLMFPELSAMPTIFIVGGSMPATVERWPIPNVYDDNPTDCVQKCINRYELCGLAYSFLLSESNLRDKSVVEWQVQLLLSSHNDKISKAWIKFIVKRTLLFLLILSLVGCLVVYLGLSIRGGI